MPVRVFLKSSLLPSLSKARYVAFFSFVHPTDAHWPGFKPDASLNSVRSSVVRKSSSGYRSKGQTQDSESQTRHGSMEESPTPRAGALVSQLELFRRCKVETEDPVLDEDHRHRSSRELRRERSDHFDDRQRSRHRDGDRPRERGRSRNIGTAPSKPSSERRSPSEWLRSVRQEESTSRDIRWPSPDRSHELVDRTKIAGGMVGGAEDDVFSERHSDRRQLMLSESEKHHDFTKIEDDGPPLSAAPAHQHSIMPGNVPDLNVAGEHGNVAAHSMEGIARSEQVVELFRGLAR